RRALAGAAGVGRAGRAALSDAHPRGGAGRLPGGARTRGPLTPAGIELLGGRRSAAQGSRDERGADRGARAPELSVHMAVARSQTLSIRRLYRHWRSQASRQAHFGFAVLL